MHFKLANWITIFWVLFKSLILFINKCEHFQKICLMWVAYKWNVYCFPLPKNEHLILTDDSIHLQWEFVRQKFRGPIVSQIRLAHIRGIQQNAIALIRDAQQGFQLGGLEFVLQDNEIDKICSRGSFDHNVTVQVIFVRLSGQLCGGISIHVPMHTSTGNDGISVDLLPLATEDPAPDSWTGYTAPWTRPICPFRSKTVQSSAQPRDYVRLPVGQLPWNWPFRGPRMRSPYRPAFANKLRVKEEEAVILGKTYTEKRDIYIRYIIRDTGKLTLYD